MTWEIGFPISHDSAGTIHVDPVPDADGQALIAKALAGRVDDGEIGLTFTANQYSVSVSVRPGSPYVGQNRVVLQAAASFMAEYVD